MVNSQIGVGTELIISLPVTTKSPQIGYFDWRIQTNLPNHSLTENMAINKSDKNNDKINNMRK